MEKWIINTTRKIENSKDLLAIKAILIDVKEKLGFNHVLYAVRLPNTLTKISHFIMDDYPEKWLTRYIKKSYVKIDPSVKHCVESQEAYCWDRLKESTDKHIIDFVNDATDHGFVGGVSIGMHNQYGETSIFSFATDKIMETGSIECCTAILHMTALHPYFHKAISRLSSYKQTQPCKPKLTPRELDCLLWSAEGKTSDEIASILSIKNPTVVFHLKNVIRKLEVSNRNQAIAKAVLFGIITPQYLSISKPRAYHF